MISIVFVEDENTLIGATKTARDGRDIVRVSKLLDRAAIKLFIWGLYGDLLFRLPFYWFVEALIALVGIDQFFLRAKGILMTKLDAGFRKLVHRRRHNCSRPFLESVLDWGVGLLRLAFVVIVYGRRDHMLLLHFGLRVAKPRIPFIVYMIECHKHVLVTPELFWFLRNDALNLGLKTTLPTLILLDPWWLRTFSQEFRLRDTPVFE